MHNAAAQRATFGREPVFFVRQVNQLRRKREDDLRNAESKQCSEHAYTHEDKFLSAHFAWFGCALYLLLILTFDYAIRSNLHPQNPPNAARMWYILSGFLIFTAVWTIRMLAKFLRPPDSTHRN